MARYIKPEQAERGAASGATAERTRQALIYAALGLFGAKGFEGTSTREIAAAARANIGSIAYHFGGKEGLRLACADFIVETLSRIAGEALGALDATGPAPEPEAARTLLHAVAARMISFVVAEPGAGEIVHFVLRELSRPSPALDRIYAALFEPMHRRFCLLWQAATGWPAESPETRLAVFSMIGQVVYFRIGREAVTRRMGWRQVGPNEAEAIATVVRANLDAVIARWKNTPSNGDVS